MKRSDNMIKIKIPATSANLGAGFDALGLALSYYNYVNMEEADGCHIKSLDDTEIPTDETNLIYHTAKTVYEICGKDFKGLTIEQTNHIPMARGLGSSSACIIAGLVGANHLMGNPLSLDEMVNLSAQIEGHPDNTAPALLGGIPDFELKTEKARACLPKEVAHSDAVYNLSRAALFSASLLTGKYENLRTAVHDRLHQPYRMELIPHARDVFDIAYTNGAYASYISGAGPTLMTIVDAENKFFGGKMRFALDNMGLENWEVKEMHIDNKGTCVVDE